MTESNDLNLDEDLRLRFRWRWGEHGIYLGVCSIIGLLVVGLHLMPRPPKRLNLAEVQIIPVRYLTVADEPPEKDDPFRDSRVIHLSRVTIHQGPVGRTM